MQDDSAALRRLTPNIPTLKINSDLGTTFDYLYLILTDWKSTVYRNPGACEESTEGWQRAVPWLFCESRKVLLTQRISQYEAASTALPVWIQHVCSTVSLLQNLCSSIMIWLQRLAEPKAWPVFFPRVHFLKLYPGGIVFPTLLCKFASV